MGKTVSNQQPIGVKVDDYVRGSSSKRAGSSRT
jgi:hypothetical protein